MTISTRPKEGAGTCRAETQMNTLVRSTEPLQTAWTCVGRACGLRVALAVALLLTVLPAPQGLVGQERVEETRSVNADARISVQAVAHRVNIEAWDRNEMHLTGTIDPNTQELEVSGSAESLRIEVRHERNTRSGFRGTLEIRVPRGARLSVGLVSGDVEVEGVEGTVRASTVSGDLRVTGSASLVQVNTVSGGIRLDTASDDIELNTVSGAVTVTGAGGRLEANTVSGALAVTAARPLESVKVNSVSGRIDLTGSLTPAARIELQSHSGAIRLRVPGNTPAHYAVETFSGSIENRMTSDEPRSPRFGPGRSLDFTVAGGGARVELHSFSGRVTLEPGG
jgi:hypothetical protein